MESVYSQIVNEFLSQTELFMGSLDDLPFETAAELYDIFKEAAKVATENIDDINPQLRVIVCDRQDKVLDRIAEVMPPFMNTGKKLNIFSPSLGDELKPWGNHHLMKDCGLSVYLLAKKIDANPVMFFGDDAEDYPYLSLLPGMEMQYRSLKEPAFPVFERHLKEHWEQMDILVLYGMYEESYGYLDAYRQVRPDGKVYCAFDMNTFWMKSIDWENDQVKNFMRQCDIIATSCRKMRDLLNSMPEIKFPCRWLANGFYNPTGLKITAEAEYKENIILTVGRIGNPEKNHEELLIAFAAASRALPEWTLRLAGPVNPTFNSFLDWFYNEHPKLKERVILTGSIVDKAKLYDEYAKAKVFTLTSRSESGTPNVYAEALFHGCKFVASDIDGADDITNYGEFGEIYTRGNAEGLAAALIKVCSEANVTGLQDHIPKAIAYAEKYYDWNKISKKLAYMMLR